MKIKILNNASEIYRSRAITNGFLNDNWYETLKKIDNKILEVETKHLFHDQYNTAPIPGVSDIGLRIMDSCVEKVIDDERPGKQLCRWCGKISEASNKECPHCNSSEYLKTFIFENGGYFLPKTVTRSYDMFGKKYKCFK